MGNNDSKQWALKTGFPFENEIELLLKKLLPDSCNVTRNHEFETLNEEDETVIRSIDFLCTFKKGSKNIPLSDWNRSPSECVEINILLDAKFSMDEKYLFLPTSQSIKSKWPYLVPCIEEIEEEDDYREGVQYYRKDLVDFAKLPALPIASTGCKVKEINKERDSVTSAALQVVQGLTHLFEAKSSTLGKINGVHRYYLRNAHYFLPVVVTNSPLFLLKDNVTVHCVEKAENDDEFFKSCELIALQIPKTQQLIKSWDKAKKALSDNGQNGLVWQDGGLEYIPILFCTTKGLESFITNLVKQLDKLPEEPQKQ